MKSQLSTNIHGSLLLDCGYNVTHRFKSLLPQLFHDNGLCLRTVNQNKPFLPHFVQYLIISAEKLLYIKKGGSVRQII